MTTATKKYTYTGKVILQRVRLDGQGYTSTGEYFGCGWPLYWYQLEYLSEEDKLYIHDYDTSGYIRENSRADAKLYIRSKPYMVGAKFYN